MDRVIVLLVVAFDFNRLSHHRNIELLALLPIGFLLFDVMGFFELFQDPVYWRLMDWVFIGIMAVSVFLLGAGDRPRAAPTRRAWRPNLDRRALMAIALVLVAMNLAAGLAARR